VGSGFVVGVGHGLKRSASERVEKVVVGGDLDSTLTMFGQTSFSSDPRTPEGLSLARTGSVFPPSGFQRRGRKGRAAAESVGRILKPESREK